ncbi:MAG: serine/threonine-protein phosphatase [Betaproteobacteria bacterium]|nr:serine/threonine-protein phosphatase [Betaproteobacteria bacterium]
MIYEYASAENLGDRKEQQDRVAVVAHPASENFVLAVLADGMGGHTGGALASQAVIDATLPLFDTFVPGKDVPKNCLRTMIMAAHEKVAAAGQGYQRDPRSTAVLAMAGPERLVWAHCGDSRLYLFRDGKFVKRTDDHSLVEILFQQGKITEAEMLTHPERSRLFSSLGGDEPPTIVFGSLEDPEAGDTVMLGSDGLWTYFEPFEMAQLISYRTLPDACDRLIALARNRASGNGDNISIALIRKPAPQGKRGLLGALFGGKAPAPPSPLEDARRYVQHVITHIEGFDGEFLSEQVEACADAEEMVSLIGGCQTALAGRMGKDKSELFARRAYELLA